MTKMNTLFNNTSSEEIAYRKILHDYCQTLVIDGYTVNNENMPFQPISLSALYCPLQFSNVRMTMPVKYDEKTIQLNVLEKENVQPLEIARTTQLPLKQGLWEYSKDKKETTFASATECGGDRVVIYGRPGSGKSTWCKRLSLACLENDEKFFDNNAPELQYEDGQMPLLLICRNLVETLAGVQDPERLSFQQLSYRMTESVLGDSFSSVVSEKAFVRMINEKAENFLVLLIVDGWDEFLDTKKADYFGNLLTKFLQSYPSANLIVTLRSKQNQDFGGLHFDQELSINPLSRKDIRLYCKRWHEVMFQGDPKRIVNHWRVAQQLESPALKHISYMTKTPYLLSNLLRLSRYNGRLPISIKELYDKTIELMLEWFTKPGSNLEKSDVKIQLEYISAYMTKKQKLAISEGELQEILCECFKNLDGYFSQPFQGRSISEYVKRFANRNCVLEAIPGGYSFPHRQMQDYLTACAIMHGIFPTDEKVTHPLDILRLRYTQTAWQDIIVFSALVGNIWTIEPLVADLLKLAKEQEEDSSIYTTLLFAIVSSGAELRETDKQKVYDICFENSITVGQIEYICHMVDLNNATFEKFKQYTENRFKQRLIDGNASYKYPWAVIQAKECASKGNNPLLYAEQLIASEDLAQILTGLEIIDVLAWCKCIDVVKEEFGRFYENVAFHVSKQIFDIVIDFLKKQLLDEQGGVLRAISLMIRSCVLAGYIYKEELNQSKLNEFLLPYLSDPTAYAKKKDIEIIFSVWPVQLDQIVNGQYPRLPESLETQYLERYRTQLHEKNETALVFTFNLCLVVGCWSTEEQIIMQFAKVCQVSMTDEISMVRIQQLEKMLSVIYTIDQDIICVQEVKLSFEGRMFLDGISIKNKHGFFYGGVEHLAVNNNNLAYLLRRGEIERIYRLDGDNLYLRTEMDLLKPYIQANDGFSLVNAALYLSGISKNQAGNYVQGLELLRGSLNHSNECIDELTEWWWGLAQKGELEGATVLLWLYDLNLINFNDKPDRAALLLSWYTTSAMVLDREYKRPIDRLKEEYGSNAVKA